MSKCIKKIGKRPETVVFGLWLCSGKGRMSESDAGVFGLVAGVWDADP